MSRGSSTASTSMSLALLLACAVGAASAGSDATAPTPAGSGESAATSPGPIEIVYEGHIDMEGHYERPHLTRTFGSHVRILWDGGKRLRLDSSTWSEGDSTRALESTLLLEDRVLMQGGGRTTWLELTGSKADEARLQALACIPDAIPHFPYGRTWKVEFTRGAPTRATSEFAHVRFGDVRDLVAYGESASPTHNAPQTIRGTFTQRDDRFTIGEAFTSATPPESARLEAQLATPPDSLVTHEDPARAPSPARVEKIADGIWAIERDEIDSRSLVVEMTDSLVVIESAVGSPQGEELTRVIHERWPGVPIRAFMFSHHHLHYLGGMRPFIAEGAKVITTRGNEAYATEIANWVFKISPDSLAKAPTFYNIEPFDGRRVLSDSRNEIVAIDIGALSSHTDEFLIFYFPRQKLLFQSELGWFTSGGTLRASRRAAGLLQSIDENHLDVERLVQSWPIVGNRRELSLVELRELVGARKE